jgi:periplasmic copper chaperone A
MIQDKCYHFFKFWGHYCRKLEIPGNMALSRLVASGQRAGRPDVPDDVLLIFALSFAGRGGYRWLPTGVQPRALADHRGSSMKMLGISVAFAIALSSAAHAYDYKVGAIEIDRPWSRAVPKGAAVAAGYLTIRNTGTEPDRLVSGSTPIAGKFELHQMSMDNGIMRMRPVTDGLEIKPGETVELKPQSFHIMMMGLKQPVEKGKPFKGTLVFEKAGAVDVDFTVEAIGATAPAAAHDMHDMHH